MQIEGKSHTHVNNAKRIKNATIGVICSVTMAASLCPAGAIAFAEISSANAQANEISMMAIDAQSDYTCSLTTDGATAEQGKTFEVQLIANTKDASSAPLSCMQVTITYDSSKVSLGDANIINTSNLENFGCTDDGKGKAIITFFQNTQASLTVATLKFTANELGDPAICISDAIAGATAQLEDKGVNYSTDSVKVEIVEVADTTELEEAVADAEEINRGTYTQDSWDAFQEALAEAQKQLENPGTQEEVDAAYEALAQAKAALEKADRVLFPDVSDPKAWYYNAVYRSVDLGLFKGYSNGNFGPNDTLTRAQAAAILWRYLDPEEANAYDKASAKNTTGMADVQDAAYYTGAANWAVENGVINGKSDGKGGRIFDPNGTITAEQLCVILFNATEASAPSSTSKIDTLTDGSSISSWAKNACEWAMENGVLSGYNNADGTKSLRPQEGVSRARTATILVNAIDNKVLVAG